MIEVDGALTLALDHQLDDALIQEGWAREMTSRLQRVRRDAGFEVTDRIQLRIGVEDDVLRTALEGHRVNIAEEVLATQLEFLETIEGGTPHDIDGREVTVEVSRA